MPQVHTHTIRSYIFWEQVDNNIDTTETVETTEPGRGPVETETKD